MNNRFCRAHGAAYQINSTKRETIYRSFQKSVSSHIQKAAANSKIRCFSLIADMLKVVNSDQEESLTTTQDRPATTSSWNGKRLTPVDAWG